MANLFTLAEAAKVLSLFIICDVAGLVTRATPLALLLGHGNGSLEPLGPPSLRLFDFVSRSFQHFILCLLYRRTGLGGTARYVAVRKPLVLPWK